MNARIRETARVMKRADRLSVSDAAVVTLTHFRFARKSMCEFILIAVSSTRSRPMRMQTADYRANSDETRKSIF